MTLTRLAPLAGLTLAALAACSPEVPDSGVHAAHNAASRPAPATLPPRSAADTAAAVLGVAPPSGPPSAPAATPGAPATQPAATGASLSAMSDNAATAGIASAPAPLSDEQDFGAVTARETIASDAARLANNRAQYVTIGPTDLPPRPDGSGPSIVAYALATTNAPGEALYRRSGIAAQTRFERSCAKYASPDQAQEAFLDAGGPKRDFAGMDPDGDGFACFWDPRPFRAARGGAPEVITKYEVIETPGDS